MRRWRLALRVEQGPRGALLREHHRLHPGNLKPLAANACSCRPSGRLFAQHVGAGLGEAGAVAVVGASGELALFGAHHPRHFILGGLMAVRTVQGRCIFFSEVRLVKKISLLHKGRWSLVVRRRLASFYQGPPSINRKHDYCMFVRGTGYGKMEGSGYCQENGAQEKAKALGAVQAVKELARERVGAPPVEKVVPHKNKKAERHKPTLGKTAGVDTN